MFKEAPGTLDIIGNSYIFLVWGVRCVRVSHREAGSGIELFIHSSHLLADPTAFEEPLLETTVTVITDSEGRLLSINQLGQYLSPTLDVLSKCTTNAQSRTTEIMQQILSI